MAHKPLPPPVPAAVRPLAPHVQAANSRAAQPKLGTPTRPAAPHVQAALGTLQARVPPPAGPRPPAPHVQAILSAGTRGAPSQARRPTAAPHVVAAAPPPIQRKKKDAQAYVRQYGLGFKASHESVRDYTADERNPALRRQGLRNAWNLHQSAHFRIPDPEEQVEAEQVDAPVDLDPLSLAIAYLAALSYLGRLSEIGRLPGPLELLEPEEQEEKHESKASTSVGPFHVFGSQTVVPLSFDEGGMAIDPETGRKCSGPKRRALYNRILGSADHVLRGHFFDDVTLRSQAGSNKPNFTWTSDRALLSAIERGSLALRGQTATINISRHDGYGYVIEHESGDRYKVYPKQAIVVTKSGGDFKTAYGITSIGTTARVPRASFAGMFHAWERA